MSSLFVGRACSEKFEFHLMLVYSIDLILFCRFAKWIAISQCVFSFSAVHFYDTHIPEDIEVFLSLHMDLLMMMLPWFPFFIGVQDS